MNGVEGRVELRNILAVEGAESSFDRSLPLSIFDRRSLEHFGNSSSNLIFTQSKFQVGASVSNLEMKPFDTNPIVSVARDCLFGFFQWGLSS